LVIRIGEQALANKVILAPMSGITDLPFRKAAIKGGVGLAVSEMVASDALARERPDMVRRAAGAGEVAPLAIQLAGRETKWMAVGARLAEDAGADIIDINIGCPARQVTGGLSGSALMRTPDHAIDLVKATVDATSRPVTLKMRTGWDETSRNAPEIAARAEEAGVQLVTVHGRTRCQFYKGRADWDFIAEVKRAVSVPVIANGDVTGVEHARTILDRSGADGVMIGRGAQGRPWLLGQAAHFVATGERLAAPGFAQQGAIVTDHYRDTLALYGDAHGVKIARKHVGWYLEELQAAFGVETGELRARLVRETDAAEVLRSLEALYESLSAGVGANGYEEAA